MECVNTYDNKKFYENSFKKYGVSAKGVHWKDEFTQYIRFKILANAIKDDILTSSIVDAGCGFGELYQYLKENNQLPLKYIGIDREESMIEVSKSRFPNIEFSCKNILEDELIYADYYICSGSLNLLLGEDFYKFLIQCWKYSNKGLIFNFLTQDSFNCIKKHIVERFCKNLNCDIEIVEYYLYNDVTFILKK